MVYLQRWHGWYHMKLLPSGRVLCTPYNHAPCHFMQSHTRKVYVCLAVTCHLRFWQNDRDLLRATGVTRGWNGYRNKSQHRKLTLEKKIAIHISDALCLWMLLGIFSEVKSFEEVVDVCGACAFVLYALNFGSIYM